MNFETLYLPLINIVLNFTLWLIPILLLISSIKGLILPRINGIAGERKVASILERLQIKSLNDVIIPANSKSLNLTQVDHIALLPDRLLVIETKNYSGAIYAYKDKAFWIQVLGSVKNKIPNPIHQNYGHIREFAVNNRIPVDGIVVFAGTGKFPGDIPEGVFLIKDLPNHLKLINCGETSPEMSNSWEHLNYIAKTDKGSRKRHLNYTIQ